MQIEFRFFRITAVLAALLTFPCLFVQAQVPVYNLHLKDLGDNIRTGHLKAYGKSPDGTTFTANSRYFERNQKPWTPVMGEFHYIRYPEEFWEEEIVKMKSAGLSIVATYIFWNAQETSPGVWNWTGNRDLRQFTELCQKHGMYVWLRIGPWSHGEQLYGGFPDWIQKMKGKRTNNAAYITEVKKLFTQIGEQTKGLYINNNGPIVGVQLENEYASGDPEHIKSLKEIAVASGITPAYFTITANTVFYNQEYEVIPLQGAYPYRGWEKGGGTATKDFVYANDQWIMTSDLGKVYYDVEAYPRGLCEQGCGSQMTFSNRFVVEPQVVEAHLNNQLGRGMNLVGYYMFHGGTQIKGLEEPGLPLTYDFQSPLTEFGMVRPSYKYLKILHHFMNDFGTDLAPTTVVRPDHPVIDPLNTDTLRYIGRFHGNEGFIFLCNTQVRVKMPDKPFMLNLTMDNETITMPSKPEVLKGETTAILPVNMKLAGCNIKYAMGQPVSRIKDHDTEYLFLYQIDDLNPEIALSKDAISVIDAKNWNRSEQNGLIILTPAKDKPVTGTPVTGNSGIGTPGTINITSATGAKSVIVLLTREQAENSWRSRIKGQEVLIISESDVLFYEDHFELRQIDRNDFNFDIFPPVAGDLNINGKKIHPVTNDIFTNYSYTVKRVENSLLVNVSSDQSGVSNLPRTLPAGLSDLFLTVDYLGSRATLSTESGVATDNLFNGTTWWIGLKRYLGKTTTNSLTFNVEKWSDRVTGIDPEVVEEVKKSPGVKAVTVHTQYFCIVKGEGSGARRK